MKAPRNPPKVPHDRPRPEKIREFVLTLTEAEINFCFDALMDKPARLVNPLLAKVQAQIAEQMEPAASPAPRAKADAQKGDADVWTPIPATPAQARP